MTGGLLGDAADWFKARQTRIGGWYEDDQGRYAFGVDIDGQRFIVTARKYLNDGQASFFTGKVVQRAIDQDAYVLLFVSGDRLVFDPAYILEHGDHDEPTEPDRRRRGEDWVSVPTDPSVAFEDWYDRRETPDGVDDYTPTGITDWGDA